MNATHPAALFEELGSSMERQVATLKDPVFFQWEGEAFQPLVADQFSVLCDVTESRLLRATLCFVGERVEFELHVRIGLPVDDAPVRRYRASETDNVWVWQSLSGGQDAEPFTSQALADACGQELRELLRSLNRSSGHLGAIVTREE